MGDSNRSIFKRETTGLEQVEAEVEGEIREFVRRDVAGLRRHPENDGKVVADNIGSLLQRVSASSVQEIDRLMAENEEWMADNLEKISSPGADENWYGDAILAQQGKYTLGCHGADVAMQSTAIPTKIQQLFDDAGSMGGLLQTATLRGQIVRFLHKHKVDVH